jgi:phosphotransacetylase
VARTIIPRAPLRVALLSANEKQIASLPSTKMGADLSALAWPDAVVYGPLSFDLATDPRSVATKGLPKAPAAAEVAGQADVLVCPGIDSANILYKTIAAMNKYGLASLANVTVGFPVPYIILSRADTLETRLESIALSSIVAGKHKR